jgi:nucleoside-diphosphate-sugar epimerase
MRILIIGAAGFIGSNLLNNLIDERYEVMGVVKSKSTISFADNKKKYLFLLEESNSLETQINKIFRDFRPEKVINAAVYFNKNETLANLNNYLISNFELPIILLQNCIKYQCEFINLSSYWQFDVQGNFKSTNIYAASKNSFEVFFNYFVDQKYLNGCSILLYDTYGNNDKREKLINTLIKLPQQNEKFKLNEPYKMINLTHILDVVDGVKKIINLENYSRFYEISNRENIWIESLVKILQDTLYYNTPIEYKKNSCSKSQKVSEMHNNRFPWPPNWQPNISLESGIQNLINNKYD